MHYRYSTGIALFGIWSNLGWQEIRLKLPQKHTTQEYELKVISS